MQTPEAKVLLVFQTEAETHRWQEALLSIGFKAINILTAASPSSAILVMKEIELGNLDLILSDADFAGLAFKAMTDWFPDVILKVLYNSTQQPAEGVKSQVLTEIQQRKEKPAAKKE